MFECDPVATCNNALIIPPFSMTFRKRGKQTIPQVNGRATNVCMYNATWEACGYKCTRVAFIV